jgi:hypothetical protein
VITMVARPRGKAFIDVAVRTGPHAALAGNLCLSLAEWRELRNRILTGHPALDGSDIKITEPKDEG